MRALSIGAPRRRLTVVGMVLIAATLLIVSFAPDARAAGGTITATSVTSPADPSFFYDSTYGAYGGFTVTGTTNSTSPAIDAVDIDCYTESAGSYTYQGTLVPNVALDGSGDFTADVTYLEVEQAATYASAAACRLAAVPAGTQPSDLSAFTGPRVLLSQLMPYYSYPSGDMYSYTLLTAQLDAISVLGDAGSYGLSTLNLVPPASLGVASGPTFVNTDSYSGGGLEVDGQQVYPPSYCGYAMSVSATQDPSNGDMTVNEVEPLDISGCGTPVASGITAHRTLQQANGGKLVVITDDFVNADSVRHTITYDVASTVDASPCCGGASTEYELPGQMGFTSYTSGSQPVGTSAPATIYANNPGYAGTTAMGQAAVTYFTAPTGGMVDFNPAQLTLPYTLTVPANGSVSLTIAYASEYTPSDFTADVAGALDIQSAPTVAITSPVGGSSTHSATATVTGLAAAASGIKSVVVNGVGATLSGSGFDASVPLSSGINTITATVTTDSGAIVSTSESVIYDPPGVEPERQGKRIAPLWRPIADTGSAAPAGRRGERLSGRVTAGSGAVSYYFAYGIRGHHYRRSRVLRLAAGRASRHVALRVGGLRSGEAYSYVLVATGRYGHAVGRSRAFKTSDHNR